MTYRCNSRDRRTADACDNREINRDLLEGFVREELAKLIFDDERIPTLVEKYREFLDQGASESLKRARQLETRISEIGVRIHNLVAAVAKTGSAALLEGLHALEQEKAALEETLFGEQSAVAISSVTVEQIKVAYHEARELFTSGEFQNCRQLINLYVERVLIYRERIEVIFNVFPVILIQKK